MVPPSDKAFEVVVDAAGAVVAAGFAPNRFEESPEPWGFGVGWLPKRDCPWLAEVPGGGGPAGVVDGLAKDNPPPDVAGVALPNMLEGAAPLLAVPPNIPAGFVSPGVVDSVVLFGVRNPVPDAVGVVDWALLSFD